MNNEVRDYRGSGSRVIGYRCFECQQIKPAMWGDICNECRAKERRHQEMVAAVPAISSLEEIARNNHDSYVMAKARLDSIKSIIDSIENRCMAADGPVTNTRHEMTDDELKRIYRLAGGTAP